MTQLISDDIESVNFADIIKNIDIIPLELRPDALISSIGRIITKDSSLYVSDFSAKSVIEYSNSGKVIRVIHNSTPGPGYISMMSDFDINSITGQVELLSPEGKIIGYDEKTKEFKDVFSFYGPLTPSYGFKRLESGMPVFYTYFKEYAIHWAELNPSNVIRSAVLNNTNELLYMDNGTPLFDLDGKVFFNDMFDYTIYSIDEQSATVYRKFDFGQQSLYPTDDVLNRLSAGEDIKDLLRDGRYIYPLAAFFENDQTQLVQVLESGSTNLTFVEDKIANKRYKFELQLFPTTVPHKTIHNGRHVAVFHDPSQVISTLKNGLYANMSPEVEDNPVILLYNFVWE